MNNTGIAHCRIGCNHASKIVAFFLLFGCKSETFFGARLQPIRQCALPKQKLWPHLKQKMQISKLVYQKQFCTFKSIFENAKALKNCFCLIGTEKQFKPALVQGDIRGIRSNTHSAFHLVMPKIPQDRISHHVYLQILYDTTTYYLLKLPSWFHLVSISF